MPVIIMCCWYEPFFPATTPLTEDTSGFRSSTTEGESRNVEWHRRTAYVAQLSRTRPEQLPTIMKALNGLRAIGAHTIFRLYCLKGLQIDSNDTGKKLFFGSHHREVEWGDQSHAMSKDSSKFSTNGLKINAWSDTTSATNSSQR